MHSEAAVLLFLVPAEDLLIVSTLCTILPLHRKGGGRM